MVEKQGLKDIPTTKEAGERERGESTVVEVC
jgi:hypothetical protein